MRADRSTPGSESNWPRRVDGSWRLLKPINRAQLPHVDGAVATSSKIGQGLDELCQRLRAIALDRGNDSSDVIAATAARCHDSVRRAAAALDLAIALVNDRSGEEFVAARTARGHRRIGTGRGSGLYR